MNSYLLENEDFTIIQKEVEKIIKENNFINSDISIYDLEETLLEKALEDLDTYNFLSEKKVIIIRNIDVLKYDDFKKDLEHLFKYIDNPSNDKLLIIEVKKLDNKTKIAKELKKKCKIVDISINTKSYIKQLLKDYQVLQDTINLIDEYCMGDITKINNECAKLRNFKFDEKKITSDDVKELVIKKEDDSKEIVFQFSRSLAEKNKRKALELYKELVNQNNDAIGIVGLLASQFRIIMQVKILEERNMNEKEIASVLGEKEFRIKKTSELTRLYSLNEIKNLIIKLSDIDLKMKTTDVDANGLIELFILNI